MSKYDLRDTKLVEGLRAANITEQVGDVLYVHVPESKFYKGLETISSGSDEDIRSLLRSLMYEKRIR